MLLARHPQICRRRTTSQPCRSGGPHLRVMRGTNRPPPALRRKQRGNLNCENRDLLAQRLRRRQRGALRVATDRHHHRLVPRRVRNKNRHTQHDPINREHSQPVPPHKAHEQVHDQPGNCQRRDKADRQRLGVFHVKLVGVLE